MRPTLDEAITAALLVPEPRPQFVAGLLATLATHANQKVVVLPDHEDPARRTWLVVGGVAGATAAGIALIGWRLARRGAA